MDINLTEIKVYLNKFYKDNNPTWGIMNSCQMLNHCNILIEVSFGIKKIHLVNRILYRVFFRYMFFRYMFFRYLKYIEFDIKKFKKNSNQTLHRLVLIKRNKN